MRKKKYVVGVVSSDGRGNVHVGAPGITSLPQGYEAHTYESPVTNNDYVICVPMAIAKDDSLAAKAVEQFIIWLQVKEANEQS